MARTHFEAEMKLLADAIRGKGRDIALAAGVSYSTYLNYVSRGVGADHDTMERILEAARAQARQLKDHLNTFNI